MAPTPTYSINVSTHVTPRVLTLTGFPTQMKALSAMDSILKNDGMTIQDIRNNYPAVQNRTAFVDEKATMCRIVSTP